MTTKKRGVKAPKRKASEPLHVMLEPEQMSRGRELADSLGISMRELVLRGFDAVHTQWRESNVNRYPTLTPTSSTARDVSKLWDPTPTQLAEAAQARHRDVAHPELVSTQSGRLVQFVDVLVLKQKLFDQEARTARLEGDLEAFAIALRRLYLAMRGEHEELAQALFPISPV